METCGISVICPLFSVLERLQEKILSFRNRYLFRELFIQRGKQEVTQLFPFANVAEKSLRCAHYTLIHHSMVSFFWRNMISCTRYSISGKSATKSAKSGPNQVVKQCSQYQYYLLKFLVVFHIYFTGFQVGNFLYKAAQIP